MKTHAFWMGIALLCGLLFVTAQKTAPTTTPMSAKRTSQGTTEWKAMGPDNIQRPGFPSQAGKLQALAVNNQNPAVMYAAGGIGPGDSGPYTEAGIYITSNGGTSWTQSNAGLTDHVVDSLWLDQSNPTTILAGTNTRGIFISTDGGAHWKLERAYGATTAFLQVGTKLYAATVKGIAMSTDSGSTWRIIKNTAPIPVRALAAGGKLIYAGLDNGQVLVHSSTGWAPTTPAAGTIWSIAVNPTNAQNAFVVDWSGYSNPSLYETQNAGGEWSQVASATNCPGPANGSPAQVVAWDSDTGLLYAGCNFFMSQSTDGGITWTQIAGANWDVRLIVTDFSGVSGNVAVGSDQGVYLSQNSGGSWQSLNGKITSSILFGVAVHGQTILTSAQDFSPISSFDGGKTWSNLESGSAVGESGTVVFNPGNPNYAYFFTTSGFFYSTDGGKTFTSDTELPSTQFPYYAGNGDLIAIDAMTPSTIYVAGVDYVYASGDWGITWFPQTNWQVSNPVMVAVDPTNSNKLFVGECQQSACAGPGGALVISTDGGASWNPPSTLGCTNCGSPVSIAVDPANPQVVFIGMSQPNGGIQVSMDGGQTFQISLISTRTTVCQAAAYPHLRFDPSGSGIIVAATNSGPYMSSNLGATWQRIGASTIPYAFTDLVWSGSDLYASTCGEGVLRIPFSG